MSEVHGTQSNDDSNREQPLEAVIAEYIRACESGASPNRREILERHPELADELRGFFAQRDQMNQLAEPIRGFGASRMKAIGPGQTIGYFGDYELLEEISRGGMGVVFKARQKTLGRIVAVKMIASGRLATAEDVKRFQTEAQAAASLQHPHIVAIHEVGQHEGCHFFSMDYIAGRDLSAMLRENLLSPQKAATYVRQLAEAIHYAHQKGTLHRDLKPSNVLIDQLDQVWITDFGLATRVEGSSDLTRTGQIMGTPSYMPPEQAQGLRSLIGPGSDVYSLGAILYECLTGRPPFRAASVVETIQQVIHTEAASPRFLNPKIPRDLETICLKCLQKEPHRRYATAKLFADDLERFLKGEPITARPINRLARSSRWCRRNPLQTALAIISVGAILALGIALISQRYNGRLKTVNSRLTTANGRLEFANASLETTSAKLQTTLQAVQMEKAEADRQRVRADDLHYATSMILADQARVRGDSALALHLLERFRPPAGTRDQRGFEWYYQWRACQGHLPLLRGHTNAVTSIAYRPDGRQLALASLDNTVTIWDALTGQLLDTLRDFPVTDITYSPDGKTLAGVGLAGGTNVLKLQDIDSQKTSSRFFPYMSGPTCVAYSSDGKRIAACSSRAIYVWDAKSTDPSITSPISGVSTGNSTTWRAISDVAFSPDGKILAVAYSDKVDLWDLETRVQTITHNDGHTPGDRTLTPDYSSGSCVVNTSVAESAWGGWGLEDGRTAPFPPWGLAIVG